MANDKDIPLDLPLDLDYADIEEVWLRHVGGCSVEPGTFGQTTFDFGSGTEYALQWISTNGRIFVCPAKSVVALKFRPKPKSVVK